MMNFNKYRNTMSFPEVKDYTETVVILSKNGNPVEVKFVDKEAFANDKRVYMENNNSIHRQFVADLKKHLGIVGHPKANILIDMAWARGHSSGYGSVAAEAEELLDLIN